MVKQDGTYSASHQFSWASNSIGNILICVEERELAQKLKVAIEADGYIGDIAYNAAEAKTFMVHKQYDALCLGLVLSDQDGLSMLEEIHASLKHRDVPVVLICGFTERANASSSSKNCLITDWVSKPSDFKHLKHTIANVVGRTTRRVRVLKIGHEACPGEAEVVIDNTVCIQCIKDAASISLAIASGEFDVISISPQSMQDQDFSSSLYQALDTSRATTIPVILDASQQGACGHEQGDQSTAIAGVVSFLHSRIQSQDKLQRQA